MNQLREFLIKKGIQLETTEYALNYEDICLFLKLISQKDVFILGGDVWEEEEGKMYITYNNWYISPENYTAKESLEKTINYINDIILCNSNKLYFVIVIDNK